MWGTSHKIDEVRGFASWQANTFIWRIVNYEADAMHINRWPSKCLTHGCAHQGIKLESDDVWICSCNTASCIYIMRVVQVIRMHNRHDRGCRRYECLLTPLVRDTAAETWMKFTGWVCSIAEAKLQDIIVQFNTRTRIYEIIRWRETTKMLYLGNHYVTKEIY